MNGILSRNAALRSAVAPHGVFNCKVKLRRGSLTSRNENYERAGRKGIHQMGKYTNFGARRRDGPHISHSDDDEMERNPVHTVPLGRLQIQLYNGLHILQNQPRQGDDCRKMPMPQGGSQSPSSINAAMYGVIPCAGVCAAQPAREIFLLPPSTSPAVSFEMCILVGSVFTSSVAVSATSATTALSSSFVSSHFPSHSSLRYAFTINGGLYESFTMVLDCTASASLTTDVSLGLDWKSSVWEWYIGLGLRPTNGFEQEVLHAAPRALLVAGPFPEPLMADALPISSSRSAAVSAPAPAASPSQPMGFSLASALFDVSIPTCSSRYHWSRVFGDLRVCLFGT
ncbi:hypothetical protein B0H13DRAFT_1855538 [Mycena leptocephala]|nr:hypothetical protein B0H13DRAFT_1855538 [Mycena leptocephala]